MFRMRLIAVCCFFPPLPPLSLPSIDLHLAMMHRQRGRTIAADDGTTLKWPLRPSKLCRSEERSQRWIQHQPRRETLCCSRPRRQLEKLQSLQFHEGQLLSVVWGSEGKQGELLPCGKTAKTVKTLVNWRPNFFFRPPISHNNQSVLLSCLFFILTFGARATSK